MIERTWIDKSTWIDGPWKHEPDKIEWIDTTTGLACLIRRSASLGFLCGYVGVERTHPLFGAPYQDIDIDVHGGLTFSDACNEADKEHGICHSAPEPVWWFGFDCGHVWDVIPTKWSEEYYGFEGVYRDIDYVRLECERLAAQIAGKHE